MCGIDIVMTATSRRILSKRGVQEMVGGSEHKFITLLAAASAGGTIHSLQRKVSVEPEDKRRALM